MLDFSLESGNGQNVTGIGVLMCDGDYVALATAQYFFYIPPKTTPCLCRALLAKV